MMSRSGKERNCVFSIEDCLLHYLPGDSPVVHGLIWERNKEVLHAGGSNTKNDCPCD